MHRARGVSAAMTGERRQAYVVGGGIAGLAAAVLLVRDGRFRGRDVHVLEQSRRFGGSLDGTGDPDSGYVIRGGRMFERHFTCTYDLFSTIPSLSNDAMSVSEEIHEFTRRCSSRSKSRLVFDREKMEAPEFGLSLGDKLRMVALSLTPESRLGARTIDDYFGPGFLESNFWLMWSTMFAFQPWHGLIEFRRYMRRFMHLLPGFNRLEGISRTPLNQYDSLIRPLLRWLNEAGVELREEAAVTDLRFSDGPTPSVVTAIELTGSEVIEAGEDDLVFVTLGSMTEDSTLGTMVEPPPAPTGSDIGSWPLWRKIAARSVDFGRPGVFCDEIEKTRWESFTVTLRDPTFFRFMERFTGNRAGTGGLVTLADSNWRLSVVLAHQPHFRNQPEGVQVFWGYGLTPNRPGNRVGKPMPACSGREILQELVFHLPLGEAAARVLAGAHCIPCVMPYITSQFMPRSPGDRPAVIPRGARNFAFLGQFCEVPDDTVFTVEYSVRTARMAVDGLLRLPREIQPVYPGHRNPTVVLRALRALA